MKKVLFILIFVCLIFSGFAANNSIELIEQKKKERKSIMITDLEELVGVKKLLRISIKRLN